MPAISLPIPGLLPTELSAGDRLTQPEFHAIYETMPKHIRAELIAGVVYMASPMKRRHGRNQFPLGAVLQSYESSTPGVEAGAGTTFILDPLSEPQPDACLYILPECGGQVVENSSGYFEGAPEFVCEVSDSTRGVDLTGKLEEYRRCGVREYVVLNLRDHRVHWFDFAADEELNADDTGLIRSIQCPGLWIHTEALLRRDLKLLFATLELGLATPDHAEFVQNLEAKRVAHARA